MLIEMTHGKDVWLDGGSGLVPILGSVGVREAGESHKHQVPRASFRRSLSSGTLAGRTEVCAVI
jgi:hypothetical protein